jgi:hypothetical protein
MQQESISMISSYFRTHLCAGPLFNLSNTWQLFSCLASPILASFGLVATFDSGVTLPPAMYSPANWADHRKLDSGERNAL